MRRPFFLMVLLVLAAASLANAQPAQDNVPLDVYLDALAQISPAARGGASAYLDAYRRRCGRSLRTIELRQAVADGAGEPVLMAMIRAAAVRDSATLQRLAGTVACARAN